MKKIFRSIFVVLIFLFSLSLTSCDFIHVLFDQTSQSPDKGKTSDDKKDDDDKGKDKDKDDDTPIDDTPVVTNRSDVDYSSITIDSFVVDYRNQYSYQEFAKDETYAAEMTEAYKTFYDEAVKVLKGSTNYELKTDDGVTYFEVGKYESTNEQLIKTQIVSVLLQIIRENPIFYFLAPSYSIGSTRTKDGFGNVVKEVWYASLVADGAYASGNSRAQMNTKIINYAAGLIENNDVNQKTDHQIVELINTNLMANLSYAYQSDNHTPEDSPWAHSVTGLYLYNKGVCECYAKNFKLLCDLLKVDSMFVIGIGNGGNHAWNIVKVNDNWYGIDVTWNDTTGNSYYLLGKEFEESHFINPNIYGPNFQVAIPELAINNYSN